MDIYFTVLILLVYLICFLGIIFYFACSPACVSKWRDRSNNIEAQNGDATEKGNICPRKKKRITKGSLLCEETSLTTARNQQIISGGKNPDWADEINPETSTLNTNKTNGIGDERAHVDSDPESTVDLSQIHDISNIVLF